MRIRTLPPLPRPDISCLCSRSVVDLLGCVSCSTLSLQATVVWLVSMMVVRVVESILSISGMYYRPCAVKTLWMIRRASPGSATSLATSSFCFPPKKDIIVLRCQWWSKIVHMYYFFSQSLFAIQVCPILVEKWKTITLFPSQGNLQKTFLGQKLQNRPFRYRVGKVHLRLAWI